MIFLLIEFVVSVTKGLFYTTRWIIAASCRARRPLSVEERLEEIERTQVRILNLLGDGNKEQDSVAHQSDAA